MALVEKFGDIFTSELPALGHGVNTQGIMGSGLAAQVRRLYPDDYEFYKMNCESGELKPGEVFPFYSTDGPKPLWIFNIATQVEPGPSADYKYVELGISNALILASRLGLKGLALPRIGAGVGGLDWDLVLPLITTVAARFPKLTVELWKD